MPSACQVVPDVERFAPGVIQYLDCQALSIGAHGYQALAAPGSPASVLVTGLITLLIALFGYRMLLGHTPGVREGVLTFLKIGLVLVLATSWPAYQAVVYDFVLHGPSEIASSVGGASGLPGSTGGLVGRLDAVDQAMKALAIQGVGAPPVGPDGQSMMPSVAPAPFIGFDTYALGFSRIGFLVSAIGSLAVVRIAGGLLLALAPLFAGFLLFNGTRGLFAGWLKALISVALASLAISIVLGVELALVEPWLATLLARRSAGLDIIGVPAELFAATIIFTVVLVAVVGIVGRMALSLSLPRWSFHSPSVSSMARGSEAERALTPRSSVPLESRSRAATIAEAVSITQRREALSSERSVSQPGSRIGSSVPRSSTDTGPASPTRSQATRRTGSRISARAVARDRG